MDRSLTEMAIRGLETERQKIDDAIRQLRSEIEDSPRRQKKPTEQPAELRSPTSQTQSKTQASEKENRLSPAGRRRIREANQRRARALKDRAAAEKQPTPAAAKNATGKRGGLTPEGRARLAEAVRQRNIARAAANKKKARSS